MSILIISNKDDITSDFIVKRLKERSASFYRLNTDEIGKTVSVTFDFSKHEYFIYDERAGIEIDLRYVKSVYFRRPELPLISNEISQSEQHFIRSELFFCLEGLYKVLGNAFWLNRVEAIREAENKAWQLINARELGFIIPESLITNKPKDALSFYRRNNGDCIIKPIKSGLVKGVAEEAIIFTNKITLDEGNIERVKPSPIYMQRCIGKKADVRVTVVGRRIYAALIHSQDYEESKVDWRAAGFPLAHTRINLPEELQQKCLILSAKFKLNFAAIDFILTEEDEFIFLEINPNGQWAWVEKRLNYNISNEICNLLVQNDSK